MEKYVLLGTYKARNNVEVIDMSDSIENLEKINETVNEVNLLFVGKDRDTSDQRVKKIIEKHLLGIDIFDEITGDVQEIKPIGIFELKPVKNEITIECTECKKVLYMGTKEGAKGTIIYCTECAEKVSRIS